jgi:hypothetical protein
LNTHYRSTWAWKEKIYLVAKTPGSRFDWPFTVNEPLVRLPLDADGDAAEPSPTAGKLGFEPLPLAMRPNAPYNVQPMGVILDPMGRKRRRTANDVDEEVPEENEVEVQVQSRDIESRQYPDTEEYVDGARVMIGFQKSAVLGLGSVFCWVDGDKAAGKTIEGWWDIEERNMGM